MLGVFVAPGAYAQLLISKTISVDQNIPDRGQYVSSLTWSDHSGLATITDVNVGLSLSSAAGTTMRLGQIYATLTFGTASESNRVAVLLNREGVSSINAFGSALASLNVTLDDSAANNIFFATNGTGTFAADGRLGVDPYGARVAYSTNQITAGLAALNGEWLSSSVWSLLVADVQAGNTAKLNSWSLQVQGSAPTSGTFDPGEGSTVTGSGSIDSTLTTGSGGSRTVSVAEGQSLSLAGGLTGSGTLATAGGGTTVLAGSSTGFTGTVSVGGTGTTVIASASALGGGTLVQSNGNSTVRFGTAGTISNAMSVWKTVFGTNGTTLGGTVTVNNTGFEVADGSTNTITGAITGSGGVTKTGGGMLVLGGTAANNFTGPSVVGTNGGALFLNKAAGTTAISGSSIAVHSGGTLLLGAANQISESTAVTMAGGTVALEGHDQTVGQLALTADSIFDFGTAGGGANTFTFSGFDTSYGGVAGLTLSNVGIGSRMVFNTNYNGDTNFNTFSTKVSFSDANLRSQISFDGGQTTLTVAAIPDARVSTAAAVLSILIGWTEYRRRRRSWRG